MTEGLRIENPRSVGQALKRDAPGPTGQPLAKRLRMRTCQRYEERVTLTKSANSYEQGQGR